LTLRPGVARARGLGLSFILNKDAVITSLNPALAYDKRRKCRIRYAIGLHESANYARKDRVVFGTLTYRPGVEWEPNHIREFGNRLSKWLQRHKVRSRMVWVAEMQERGAVHYHYALWVSRRLTVPMPDKQGWWPHGITNVQYVKKSIYKYLSKYLTKPDNAPKPKGLRSYGIVGLGEKSRDVLRVWTAPRWLQYCIKESAVIKKYGPYWIDLTEKKVYLGPFRCYGFEGGKGLIIENVGYITVFRLEPGVPKSTPPRPIPKNQGAYQQ